MYKIEQGATMFWLASNDFLLREKLTKLSCQYYTLGWGIFEVVLDSKRIKQKLMFQVFDSKLKEKVLMVF